MGESMVPLGKGLFQSAKHTVPNEPSPTSLMTEKSLGPSRMRDAAVVGIREALVAAVVPDILPDEMEEESAGIALMLGGCGERGLSISLGRPLA